MENLAKIRELSVKYTLKDRKDIEPYTLLTHLSCTPYDFPHFIIHYYLIENARSPYLPLSNEQTEHGKHMPNGNNPRPNPGSCFSVLVTIYENGKETGRELAFDVTHDRNEAENLLSLLRRNEVTPCTLKDIIYDYLA